MDGVVVASEWESARAVTAYWRSLLPKIPLKWVIPLLLVVVAFFEVNNWQNRTRVPNKRPADSASETTADLHTDPKRYMGQAPDSPLVPNSRLAGLTEEQREVVNSLNRIVYFDFDSTDIKGEGNDIVADVARILMLNRGVVVVVGGHTDNRENDASAMKQGAGRALSVKRALVLQGALPDQVRIVAYGSTMPRVEGNDEGAWSRNRRAEIHFLRWNVERILYDQKPE